MKLKPTEKAILVDLLAHGDDGAGNISRRCGYKRDSVSRRFGGLIEAGLVKAKGNGVYRLTDRGRDEASALLRQGYNPWLSE